MIENDVSLFSLTDHNIINLETYREYYAKYDGSKDPLLLVGVELDILVNNSGKQKTYHSLLIFNYSDIKSAKAVSSRLEKEYKSKGLEKAKRVLTIDEIVKIFPEDDFFFIPHAGNTKSIVDSYQGNIEDAQKMVLLMQSAFEKVPEKNIQIYNDGFNNVLEERFRNKNDHVSPTGMVAISSVLKKALDKNTPQSRAVIGALLAMIGAITGHAISNNAAGASIGAGTGLGIALLIYRYFNPNGEMVNQTLLSTPTEFRNHMLNTAVAPRNNQSGYLAN